MAALVEVKGLDAWLDGVLTESSKFQSLAAAWPSRHSSVGAIHLFTHLVSNKVVDQPAQWHSFMACCLPLSRLCSSICLTA